MDRDAPSRSPSRIGLPQSPLSASLSSTARKSGRSCSSARRNSSGSRFRRVGDLVDEALDREGVLRRADRAPEHHRHMGVLQVDADLQRLGAIGTVGAGPRPPAARRRSSACAQPSERVIEPTAVRKSKPAGDPSSRERRAQPERGLRAIAIVRMSSSRVQISLTGLPTAFETSTAWTQFVVDRAPAEAAAEEAIVNEDRLAGRRRPPWRRARSPPRATACPSRRRCDRDANARSRSAAPSAHAPDTALRRPPRRVFAALVESRVDVAVGRRRRRAVRRARRDIRRGTLAVGRGRSAEVPVDRQRGERLLGAPEIVGDDRDAVRRPERRR